MGFFLDCMQGPLAHSWYNVNNWGVPFQNSGRELIERTAWPRRKCTILHRTLHSSSCIDLVKGGPKTTEVRMVSRFMG